MEFPFLQWTHRHLLEAFALLVATSSLLYFLHKPKNSGIKSSSERLQKQLIPSPPSLPILGNIHLLGAFPVRSLTQLSHHYGPIYYLQLGSCPTVVISSAALAKEILIDDGHILTKRPTVEFGRRLFYGEKGLLMMPYNSRWRSMRKICNQELFGIKKLQTLKYVRNEEVSSMILAIAKESEVNEVIDLTGHITTFTSSVITRMVISKKFYGSVATHFKGMMRELGELIGVPILSDFFPGLKWLDVGRHKRRMDVLHKSLDPFLESLLQERRNKMRNNTAVPSDLLNTLLSLESPALDSDDIKAIVEDMLGAGTDTLGLSIEWTMAEILCRQTTVLKRLQEELDLVVGESCRLVDEVDIFKLSYLRAVVKESFRLHPPAPVVFRHVPKRPCSVAGYSLPENATVMVNVWGIARDPTSWTNPEVFIPERFLGSNVDLRGANFELIPFGAGRRRCPGMPLAITLVELVVANLLHSFDWRLPVGVKEEEVLRECAGVMAIRKVTPLLAIPQRFTFRGRSL